MAKLSLYQTFHRPDGLWEVTGTVDGDPTTVIVEFDGDPTVDDAVAALGKKGLSRDDIAKRAEESGHPTGPVVASVVPPEPGDFRAGVIPAGVEVDEAGRAGADEDTPKGGRAKK